MSDKKPITLDDLFSQARGFADFCLRQKPGDMRPTFFLYGLHPILPPPNPGKEFIQMHVLATDMDLPETKDKVATLARLLNIANGSTMSLLAIEVWMSQKQDGTMPRDADDRQEYIMLLGESHTGNAQQFYPIIRSDNGNYFGLGEMHTGEQYIRMTGRFSKLLLPYVADTTTRQIAKTALALLDINMVPIGPH